VQLAEPEDHVRVFLDAGEPIKSLLADLNVSIEKRSSAQRGYWSQFVGHLLEAFAGPGTKLPVKSGQIQNLVEPLSDRELEVLRLLAAGKKNQEIADALFVVLGTVKAHINSIYRKLEVSTRVQAVTRARELGLL
jgi:LuxR family maltose regulon positive regulatory protein